MIETNRKDGLKYHTLAVQFGEDFSGTVEIRSKEICDWGHARGVSHKEGATDQQYARHVVKLLRSACTHDDLGANAYRIVSKSPHIWAKETITMDTLSLIYDEAIRKANGAVVNGNFRNLKAGHVLMHNPLPLQDAAIIKYMLPRVYDRLTSMLAENRKDFDAISNALAASINEKPAIENATD